MTPRATQCARRRRARFFQRCAPVLVLLSSIYNAAGQPREDIKVTGIEYSEGNGSARVVLYLNAPVSYESHWLKNPDRVYFDLHNSRLGIEVRKRDIFVGSGLMNRLTISQWKPSITRLVLSNAVPIFQAVSMLANPPRMQIEIKPRTTPAKPAPGQFPPLQTSDSHPAVAPFMEPAPAIELPLQAGSVVLGVVSTGKPPLPRFPANLRGAVPPAVSAPKAGLAAANSSTAGSPMATPVIPAGAPAGNALPLKPAATDAASRTIRIPHVLRAPKLRDFLEGTARENEVRVSDFRQREPGDGSPTTQPTTAYLSYDNQNIYAVFVCQDEPGKVRARLTKREDIDADDQVSLYLDTFRDGHRTYVFTTNALGIQRDSILTEGQGDDSSFDTLWHSDGRVTADGFIVWIAIPFKSLRFAKAERQTWGIALGRSFIRNNDKSFWPYITMKKRGFVDQMGALEGLESISPGRNLQFIPYGAFANARVLDSQRPGFVTERDKRAGLDSKVVLRDSLSLDVTVNPDFSQVESDDPQVTINQRYEVYFPEKRPFFLENASFFQTPINLFFSRRIVDPEFGTRLTGKLGHWTLGALGIDDRAPGERVGETDPLRGDRAAIGVARVQREFGSQSSIGMFASSREFGSASNNIVSLDMRLKLNSNWTYTGQFVDSFTRQQNGQRRRGSAFISDIGHSGRHFSTGTQYTDRSPNFQSDLGFIPRVNIRQVDHSTGYFFRPQGGRVIGFGPSVAAGATWDHAGRLTDWYGGGQFGIYFKGPYGFTASEFEFFTLYLNHAFHTRRTDTSFYLSAIKWLELAASYGQGTNVNYNPAQGLQPFIAGSKDVSFRLTWRPNSRFRMDNTYYFSYLGGLKKGSPVGFNSKTTVYDNHLFRSKMNYQFTRALSVRTIVDYYGVLPNSSLIWQDKYKRLFGDFLLTYQLNPGTALFIGYTNRYENLALAYNGRYSIVPTTSLANSTARQVFIKLNYLFRY